MLWLMALAMPGATASKAPPVRQLIFGKPSARPILVTNPNCNNHRPWTHVGAEQHIAAPFWCGTTFAPRRRESAIFDLEELKPLFLDGDWTFLTGNSVGFRGLLP